MTTTSYDAIQPSRIAQLAAGSGGRNLGPAERRDRRTEGTNGAASGVTP